MSSKKIYIFQLSPAGKMIQRKETYNSYQDIFIEDAYWESIENIFYTTAMSSDDFKNKRLGEEQSLIAFDLDNVPENEIQKHYKIVQAECHNLGINPKSLGLVASGNGIHVIVLLGKSFIPSIDFYKLHRPGYKEFCKKIEKKCSVGVIVDTSVFKTTQIMRLPGTINCKLNVKKECRMIAPPLTVNFDMSVWAKRENVASPTEVVSKYPKVDVDFLVNSCEFIKNCINNPEKIHEPEGYALLQILAFIPDKKEWTRELFKKFTSSKSLQGSDFDKKFEQALTKSGPRTCENINEIWDKCSTCKFNKRVRTPLQLKSENFIGTESIGFTTYTYDKNGRSKMHRHYHDIYLAFKRDCHYKFFLDQERIMIFDKTHYKQIKRPFIKEYAERKFEPHPNIHELAEFYSKIGVNNQHESYSEFFKPLEGLINFKNGIYDTKEKKLLEHSPQFGFSNCLPYEIDLKGDIPEKFFSFLKKVTCNRPLLMQLLLEFMGYIVSGDPYILENILVLSGTGANGKSTLLNLISKMVGPENVASEAIAYINDSQFAVGRLANKLVNLSEEEPIKSFRNVRMLKKLSSPGLVAARNPYETGFIFSNRAKLIITYNVVPRLGETSAGIQRRLLIVPFDFSLDLTKDKIDTGLLDDLSKEIPSIYYHCLQAYSNAKANRRFTRSEDIIATLRDVVESSDALVLWFTEIKSSLQKLPVDDKGRLTFRAMYRKYATDYEEYSEDNSPPKTFRAFASALKIVLRDNKLGWGQYRIDGRRHYFVIH